MNVAKEWLLVATVVGLSWTAQGDCRDAYANEIKRLDGMLNPARVGLGTFGATAIAVPVALVAVGATVAAGTVVGAPAAAAAAGGFYAAVEIRKATLRRTLMLIKDSLSGNGKVLEKVTKRLHRKHPTLTKEQVAKKVLELNSSKALCAENESGKVKFFGIFKVRSVLNKAFGSAEASEPEEHFDL